MKLDPIQPIIVISNFESARTETVITDSYHALHKLFGSVKHFSFPYGTLKHFPKHAREIVSQSGFTSCISAIRGCHLNQTNDVKREQILIKRYF